MKELITNSNIQNVISNFDKRFIYHPYESLRERPDALEIVKTKGVYLYTSDGKKLIDGISSWWACWAGFGNKQISNAIKKQLATMSHVMFAGITHPAAYELSKRLISLTPDSLDYIFYADSGSVATEVALKMAIQYQNLPSRSSFMALANGYHGDTLGAMSVSDWGEHHIYQNYVHKSFLFETKISFNQQWDDKEDERLESFFKNYQQNAAAFILEPLLQGAGGMKMYHKNYLKKIRELCEKYDILMIADEIATGFGRTGKMFAIEHANIKPDIMLLAKGLTAGFMTLSAVITSDKVYERIKGSDIPKIMHGPTFMANPLALSCAIASIDEFFRVDALSLVQNIEKTLSEKLLNLAEKPHVKDIRVLGACAAIELDQPVKIYQMQKFLIERGVWLRPFGNVIYLFPPFVISKKELSKLIEVTVNLVDALPTIFASS